MSRTGHPRARIAAEGEFTRTWARAGRAGVATGRNRPEEIDLIIVATCTPDTVFPSTACYIQHKIGATRAAAYDVQAACSGASFTRWSRRSSFIAAGSYETVLVIGAEKTFLNRQLAGP